MVETDQQALTEYLTQNTDRIEAAAGDPVDSTIACPDDLHARWRRAWTNAWYSTHQLRPFWSTPQPGAGRPGTEQPGQLVWRTRPGVDPHSKRGPRSGGAATVSRETSVCASFGSRSRVGGWAPARRLSYLRRATRCSHPKVGALLVRRRRYDTEIARSATAPAYTVRHPGIRARSEGHVEEYINVHCHPASGPG